MDQAKRPQEPEPDFQHYPPFWQHYCRALEYLKEGKPEKAAQKFRQAAIADPELWNDNANRIAKSGHPDVAIASLREVIRLHEGRKDVLAASWCTIGNVLYDIGQTDAALEHFEVSWSHFKTGGASANIALMNLRRGKIEEATKWINISLEINHWNTEAQMIQADINFQKGHYLTAFKQYECRWRSMKSGLSKIHSNKPEWNGARSDGRLLIVGEQGMGDVIVVLRYAKAIQELGLKQTWVIHPPLVPLAQRMKIPNAEFITPGPLPDYDCHLSAVSLHRVLNTSLENIPAAPYIPIAPRPSPWTDNLKVGIAWRGAKANPNDHIRSTNLGEWKPVLEVDGIEFHSLQVGDGEDEAKAYPFVKTHPAPKDWTETANLVAGMDLVISVDTAIVHLAGAMGVTCWCALHCRPYYVYPQSRSDCPWYSTVTLFKQRREFEWQPVFERIAKALENL